MSASASQHNNHQLHGYISAAESKKTHHLQSLTDFPRRKFGLEGVYAASAAFGSTENIDLLARGGIYGQMLAFEAELDPFGPGGAAGTAEVAIVGVSATSDITLGVPI